MKIRPNNAVFNRMVTMPAPMDDEQASIGRLLLVFSWINIAAFLILGLGVFLAVPAKSFRAIFGAIIIIGLFGIVIFLTRRGKLSQASILTVIVLEVTVTMFCFTGGGLSSGAFPGYFVIVFLAAITMGGRAAFGMVVISSLLWLAMAILAEAGLLPPAPYANNPLVHWLGATIFLVILVVLQEYTSRVARKSLSVARTELAERVRAEQAWLELNATLEERVHKRTAEVEDLAESLSLANDGLVRAMHMKDEFMASMSHELRTPLTGILGLAEALQVQTYGELTPGQARAVSNIESSGQHLLSLINDILDLAKLEAGKVNLEIEPVNLAEICMACLQLVKGLANKKNQRVAYSIAPSEIWLAADPRRLKQMLVNLLSNAVKYTQDGGRLGLEVIGSETEQQVTLTVWDTGIGIKADDVGRLFKPFVQLDSRLAREQSGTGLGLALVNDLATLHGGSVTVESEIDKGSRFTITLPWQSSLSMPESHETVIPDVFDRLPAVLPENDPKPAEEIDDMVVEGDGPLVMVVDDSDLNVDILSDFLISRNMRVVTVQDGWRFLDLVNRLSPQVVLMDVQMPGIDGLETIRRLRAMPDARIAGIPVIAVTALAMVGDRERCLQAGANEYLSKPFSLSGLVDLIKTQLS